MTVLQLDTAVPIARGATGEVLKAWDPEHQRFVAIKLLRANDPDWASRMQREARTLERLRHPNICPVYGTGEHNGLPCLYLRYIEGQPIDQALADADLATRFNVLADVAAAVQSAHAAGIVHRDLKPGNILVEMRDDRPHAWVLDFGLARSAEDTTLTQAGQLLGTPGYMSPEQARGEPATPRSDLYALGVLAFKVLAGQLPHQADSVAELLLQVANRDAPSLRSIDPALPESANRVVQHCLERLPRHRYRTARKLHDDLRACAAGESVEAPSLGPWYQIKRSVSRSPVLSAAVAVAALSLVGALAYGGWQALRLTRVAADISSLERATARAESALRTIYSKPLHDVRSEVALVLEEASRALADLGEDTALAGPRYAAMGRLAMARGDFRQAIQDLGAALEAGDDEDATAELLAHAHAEAYFDRVSEAARIRDPARFEAALARARGDHLEPAARLLENLGQARLATTASLQARLTGDRDQALVQLQRVPESPEIWPLPRWQLAQDLLRELAVENVREGAADAARGHLDQARQLALKSSELARSDPSAYRRHCSLMSVYASTVIVGQAAEMPDLTACEYLLVADPGSENGRLTAAAAFERRARLARNQARDPSPFLERAMAAIGDLDEQAGPRVLRRLGSLNYTAAAWAADSGEASIPLLEKAVTALDRAWQADDRDPDLARELASALSSLASSRYYEQSTSGDEEYARATSLLRDAAARWPEQAGTPAMLSSVLADQAYSRYVRGQPAEDIVAEAVTMAEQAARARPDHIPTQAALGRAALTRMDYQVLTGQDPRQAGRIMEAAFDRVIEATPRRFAARFNQAAGLASLANALFDLGQPDADLTDRFAGRVEELENMVSDTADIALLSGWLALFQARHAMNEDANPEADFAQAEANLKTATGLPIDAFLAWQVLAHMKGLEHQWRMDSGQFDPATFEADLAMLAEGLVVYPDQHSLRALIGSLAGLGATSEQIEKSRRSELRRQSGDYRDQAIAANPLLRNRFGKENDD